VKGLTDTAFKVFWHDLHSVSDIVHDKLTDAGAADLTTLTIEVRSRCDHRIADRTMVFARALLDELAETSVGHLYSQSLQQPPWFGNYLSSGVCTVDKKYAISRIEEFLMEQLTAAWLVLYFLGAPMGHPWERVRRLADEQGGYPAGACMTKLIGDVYRRSRLEFHDDGPPNGALSEPHVMVLSMHPSLLIKELLTRYDDKKVTPGALHQLGRCYALFQLRLYVLERHSLRYIVSLQALKECWNLFPKLPALHTATAAQLIVSWLAQLFPDGPISGHAVELHKGKDFYKMSPCALGCKTGVYALESGADGTRFVGNRVSKRLLQSLRHRLMHTAADQVVPLLGMSAKDLRDNLR